MINTEALKKYLKLWHDKRGYDPEYLFTTAYGGQPKQMSETWGLFIFALMSFQKFSAEESIPISSKPHASPICLKLTKSRLKLVSKYSAQHEDDFHDFQEKKNKTFM